ncbi:T9SS type A sorting domain-containing protein [Flavobacterium pallidum]|uniref:Secretion system C-terminal sorting domain-containing protein n=1 Tax=Flavobacterium pallidum TaxID=2172098 RepID=A0A2S1SIB1_9FLAO|nr:T9SS type A sorting domain-containing protein [Flavobacterium pallidum]AWI26121.1 hypothetical protein HYN49_09550 [Flavobacterium pallidum]
MKKIFTLLFTMALFQSGVSQISLEHTYPNSMAAMAGINLSDSGFKYRMVDPDANQVVLYNPDHSIFKSMAFDPYPDAGRVTVWYISEKTFDLDNGVEFMVSYGNLDDTTHLTRIYNEDGTILFERIGEVPAWLAENEPSDAINAIFTAPGGTKMILNSSADHAAKVYSLPGSLPLALHEPDSQIIHPDIRLFPNPTKNNKISIAYTLPGNVKIGKVTIYNMSGQPVKTFEVDNHFNTIELDTGSLSAGTYVCEVSGNSGRISTSQFIVQN